MCTRCAKLLVVGEIRFLGSFLEALILWGVWSWVVVFLLWNCLCVNSLNDYKEQWSNVHIVFLNILRKTWNNPSEVHVWMQIVKKILFTKLFDSGQSLHGVRAWWCWTWWSSCVRHVSSVVCLGANSCVQFTSCKMCAIPHSVWIPLCADLYHALFNCVYQM